MGCRAIVSAYSLKALEGLFRIAGKQFVDVHVLDY
jgi:hypothetical protein